MGKTKKTIIVTKQEKKGDLLMKKTKKVIVLSLMLITMLIMTGCEDSTASQRKAHNDRQVALAVKNDSADLIEPTSLQTSAEMAADSMRTNHIYQVRLLLTPTVPVDDWVANGLYEVPFNVRLRYNHGSCRDWTASQMVIELCESEELRTAREAFNSGQLKVAASIMSWEKTHFWSQAVEQYWLVDQDGDGVWDYAANTDEVGEVYFDSTNGGAQFRGVEPVKLPADWSGTTKEVEKML